MRRWRAIVGAVALVFATIGGSAAWSGAWPREPGEVFLSFGANVALFDNATRPVHYDPTLYFEYGLTRRVTIGFDGYTADAGTAGAVLGWGRLALGNLDAANKWAVSAGYGLTQTSDGDRQPAYRIGAHWGRGFSWGWMAFDTSLLARPISQTNIEIRGDPFFRYVSTRVLQGYTLESKEDLTIGWRFADDWALVTLLSGGISAPFLDEDGEVVTGSFYAKIAPSLVWSPTDTVSLRVGLTQALTGDGGSGLLMEAWVEF